MILKKLTELEKKFEIRFSERQTFLDMASFGWVGRTVGARQTNIFFNASIDNFSMS